MKIALLDLKAQYQSIKEEIRESIDEVLDSQHFILGPKVKRLEEEIACYSQCKYALGVSSGTDALLLALMGLDVGYGDFVVTTPYTFFATAGCVARLGAKPLFVDIDPVTYNIDPKQLVNLLESMPLDDRKKIKAVMPVHLFGQMADMEPISDICNKFNLKVVEDAAQAIGSEYIFKGETKRAGGMGDIGCFSFFPSKNLGGYGDGGMVVTNDEHLYKKMKILRAHGSDPKYYHKLIGGNFRLDEIQAAVLLVKLKYLDEWTQKRQDNADLYNELLKTYDKNGVLLPTALYKADMVCNYHIYNQYCIRTPKRDRLKEFLTKNGVGTEVYYPVPMHLQECFSYLGYSEGMFPNAELAALELLALPVYPELNEDAIRYVSSVIIRFLNHNE